MNLACRVALSALLVVSLTGAVRAQSSEYQRHYDRARELSRDGDRRGAIKEFEAAYAADPNPGVLFNIGLAYRQLALDGGGVEDAQRAVDSFAHYRDRYREAHGVQPNDIETVKRYIDELRGRFGVKEPAASVAPTPPAPEPAPKPPVAVNPEQPPQPPVSIVEPKSEVRTTPPASPAQSKTRLIVGSIIAAAGVVAVGSGIALLALSGRDGQQADYPIVNDYSTHVRTLQIAGGVLAGVGAAAVVGGIVGIALAPREKKSTALRLAPTGSGFVLSGRF